MLSLSEALRRLAMRSMFAPALIAAISVDFPALFGPTRNASPFIRSVNRSKALKFSISTRRKVMLRGSHVDKTQTVPGPNRWCGRAIRTATHHRIRPI